MGMVKKVAATLGGLAAAGAPMVMAAQPAGAVTKTGEKTGALTFVSYSTGQAVTCSVDVVMYVYDDHSASAQAFVYGSDCNSTISMDVEYRDSAGRQSYVLNSAFQTTYNNLRIGGVYTPASNRVSFTFNDCNTSLSATCSLTVTASPK